MQTLKTILDALKNTKHSTPQPVFCPKCSSPRIRLKESYGILPQIYHCDDCGYEGHIILELEPEED